MDQVDLPLLGADDTVEDAIKRMNQYDRRFILVRLSQRRIRSFSNKEVLQAWAKGTISLREIEGGEEVTMIEVAQVAAAGGMVDPPEVGEIASRPWGDPQREVVRAQMDAVENSFGISGTPNEWVTGMVDVFTLHEEIRNRACSKIKQCICSKNSNHQGTSPPEFECPHCDGTWRCA
jgi:hypothetical protein